VVADVDWHGGAAPITALIDIRLRPGADDAAFEEAVIRLPGVVSVEHLAGPVHYVVRLSLSGMEAIDTTIRHLKEQLGAETNTRIVTRTLRG